MLSTFSRSNRGACQTATTEAEVRFPTHQKAGEGGYKQSFLDQSDHQLPWLVSTTEE